MPRYLSALSKPTSSCLQSSVLSFCQLTWSIPIIPKAKPLNATMSKTYSRAEVLKHNTPDDVWCIIDHKVYELTDFLDAHPGGNVVLQQIAGTVKLLVG